MDSTGSVATGAPNLEIGIAGNGRLKMHSGGFLNIKGEILLGRTAIGHGVAEIGGLGPVTTMVVNNNLIIGGSDSATAQGSGELLVRANGVVSVLSGELKAHAPDTGKTRQVIVESGGTIEAQTLNIAQLRNDGTVKITGNTINQIGDASTFGAFSGEGSIDVGDSDLTIASLGSVSLKGQTTIKDGTLTVDAGFAGKLLSLGNGSLLIGDGAVGGTVDASVSAGFGSVIQVTDGNQLTIGASERNGFESRGAIFVGNGSTLNLSDSDQALLGSFTDLDNGTITAGGIDLKTGHIVQGEGSINVGGGKILIDGGIHGDSAIQVINITAGSAEGIGTISNVTFTAPTVFSPGHSPGTVDIAGDTTLLGETLIEIAGFNQGAEAIDGYDLFNLLPSGTLSFNNQLTVEFFGGFNESMLSPGDFFDIAQTEVVGSGFITDNFTTFDLPTLSGGKQWDVVGVTSNTAGNEVYRLEIITTTAVPEPGTNLALVSALLLPFLRRATRPQGAGVA